MFRHLAIKIFNRFPKRFTHCPVYFQAQRLIEQTRIAPEAPETRQSIAQRLAFLLQGALRDVPHYRDLGIDPDSVIAENAGEMLCQFPYLSKQEVMAAPERFVSDKYPISRLKIVTSGGSTGQGIKMYKSYAQMTAEWAFFDYEWFHRCGWTRKAKCVRIGSDSIRRDDQSPCYREGDRLMVSPYHTNERWIPTIVNEIEQFNPEYFHVFASCIVPIMIYLATKKRTMPGIKGVFLASERIFEPMLDQIKSIFPNATPVFHYGLTERSNLAWGSYENGEISYRMDKAYSFSENFIHDDGRAEIVGTNYWNDVMPLIRYRTSDFGLIDSIGKMKRLEGREQEFLISKDGNKFPGFAIYIAESTWDEVKEFQIIQYEIGKIEFHLVPHDKHLSQEFRTFLMQDQMKKWGNLFDMKIVEETCIKKTRSGKKRLVISYLHKKEELR